jgi:predicted dehydrogenase
MASTGIAVVGCGYWGPNLIRNFAHVQGGHLVALCDRDQARLEAAGRDLPAVMREQDYEAILEAPGVHAVAIATSATTHYSLAKKALLSGKHVFVEKPLCLHAADAADLVAIASQQERLLMVGHLLKYHPAVEFLKRMVEAGLLGDLRYVYSQRLNLGQVRHDENALWSLGPHDIAVANFLMGERPLEVCAVGQSYLQSGIQDVVFLTIRYPGQRLAHLHVSWLDPHKTRKLTVVGSRQMAVFDDMEPSEKVRLYDKGVDLPAIDGQDPAAGMKLRVGDICIPCLPGGEPLLAECQHFIDCIRSGRAPRSDGWDGLRVVQVLEAAERSLRDGGRPVPIEEYAEGDEGGQDASGRGAAEYASGRGSRVHPSECVRG